MVIKPKIIKTINKNNFNEYNILLLEGGMTSGLACVAAFCFISSSSRSIRLPNNNAIKANSNEEIRNGIYMAITSKIPSSS